jgi:hypothetical protein
MRHTAKVIIAVKKLVTTAVVFFALGISFANATFINFDELPYDTEHPEFYGNPVTDQYISQGVLFSDAYLQRYNSASESIISPPHYLLSATSMKMTFLGEAPTFVSMHVNSWRHEIIYFTFYGDSGLIASLQTKGFMGPFGEDLYEPNQLISLAATEGIRSIYVNESNPSKAGEIDDLTFTYGVPEPSLLVLFSVGLLLVLAMPRRKECSVQSRV